MKFRISRDECGRNRFTEQEIVRAIANNETVVLGHKNHCLCRKKDGKVLAEIQKEE